MGRNARPTNTGQTMPNPMPPMFGPAPIGPAMPALPAGITLGPMPTGTQTFGIPAGFNPNSVNFDLPGWQGPFAAPLTGGQMDAMNGFQGMMTNGATARTLNAAGGNLNEAARMFGVDGITGPAQISAPGLSDFSEAANMFRGVANQGAPTAGQQTMGAVNQLFGQDLSNTDFSGVMNALNGAMAGANARTDFSSLMPSLNTAVGAPRFDTSEMFRTGEQVFASDMERANAQLREEMGGLGLGAGSSDRNDAITRATGDATARFRLGQQDIARQGFESAEARRLNALGLGADILGRGTQEAFQGAGLGMQGAGMMADIAGRPFAEQLAEREMQASLLNPMLGAEQMQGQMGLAAGDQRLQAAQSLAQLAGIPFEQAMQIATNITLPQQQMGQQAQMFNAELAGQGMDRALGAEANMFNRYGQQYAMGADARGAADAGIQRAMAEFARTQGGGLAQMLALMQASQPINTGFGPSPMSQAGSMIGGIAQGVGAAASIYDLYRNRNRR